MKQKILILGAGRAATALIDYLLNEAAKNDWFVTVADFDEELAKEKVGHSGNGRDRSIKYKQYQKAKRADSGSGYCRFPASGKPSLFSSQGLFDLQKTYCHCVLLITRNVRPRS